MKSRLQTFKLIFHYCKPHRRLVLKTFFIMIVAAFLESFGVGMLIPLLQAIDKPIQDPSQEIFFSKILRELFLFLHIPYDFVYLISFFGIIMLGKYLWVAWHQHESRKLSASVRATLIQKAHNNLMNLPLSYYYKVRLGDLVSTLFSSSSGAGSIMEYIMLAIKTMLFAGLYVTWGFMLSAPFTFIVIVLIGSVQFFLRPLFQRAVRGGAQEKNLVDAIHSFLFDSLGGIRIVKGFVAEELQKEKLNQLTNQYARLAVKMMDNKIFAGFFVEPLMMLLMLGAMVVAVKVLQLPLVFLITLLFVFMNIAPQVRQLNNNMLHINELLPHFSNIHDIINSEDKNYLHVGRNISLSEISSSINLVGVGFKYGENLPWVLEDISLEIKSNQTVAFVGGSGGGKSTLVDLILRHHDPVVGKILVDGIPLTDIKLENYRALIGVVDQDPYLFNTTIEENIRFGKTDATNEEVIVACKMAHAHHFIEGLKDGYSTVVGNRGMTLSGGQKQRIALARALIRNPQILILDEATSALDSESEKMIQLAIEELKTKKTIIMIAHRLSTIVHADQIFFIEKGQIIESGDHDKLIQEDGRYRQFYEMQTRVASAS